MLSVGSRDDSPSSQMVRSPATYIGIQIRLEVFKSSLSSHHDDSGSQIRGRAILIDFFSDDTDTNGLRYSLGIQKLLVPYITRGDIDFQSAFAKSWKDTVASTIVKRENDLSVN